MQTASIKGDIESVLASFHGRRYCVLTNRGTTALAAAFHALDRPGEGVVFPAVMCSIPCFSASFAGMKPLFADVGLEDGNFDRGDLERVLGENRGRVAAVVPLHMFGQPEDMENLAALADRHGVSVVEDAALSMGAFHKGKRTGGWGRLSCLSFVRKMLPLEMGGAVLTDEPGLAERVRAFVDRLPRPAGPSAEAASAMRAFHSLTGYAAGGDWRRRELLLPFEGEFRRLLLEGTGEKEWEGSVVLRELGSLDEVVKARRVRAEVYETALSHPRIRPMSHGESCFFAYPVRLEGLAAEDVLAFAAERGLNFKRISYPVIAPVFGDDRFRPNAARLEREAIGFPVDDDQPASDFWGYAEDFVRLLNEYVAALPGRPPFDGRGKMEMRMAL